MPEDLAAHLATMSREQLAELLATRVDVTVEPAPETLAALAGRLLAPESIVGALGLVTLPQLQVAEAVAALGDGWDAGELAELLGVAGGDAALAEALAALSRLALVWPGAGAHLRVIWPHPLGLGPDAAELLTGLDVVELREVAATLGLPVARTKRDLVVELTAWLGEPEHVRALVARAPDEVRQLLERVAREPAGLFGIPGMMVGKPNEAPSWACDRGLLVPGGWGVAGVMPAEVAVALRGGRAPFDPSPPVVSSQAVAEQVVQWEASAAATATLELVVAVSKQTPVALLKSGGLGVRELRRIAKGAGCGEEQARFAMELVTGGGLVEAGSSGLVLSEAFEEYAGMEPAEQLLEVVAAWLQMPACPSAAAAGEPALCWREDEEDLLAGLRTEVLRTLVSWDRAVPVEAVAGLVAWHRPLIAAAAGDDFERFAGGIWREAHQVGLLAHGAVTALCRRLLADDGDLLSAASAMVPEPVNAVLLQNDLTAVVTGTPSAPLLRLLDQVADAESRSGAWTWRFSPASVLRALDGGASAAALISELQAKAVSGVPQALEYLITDVGRRHGRVQVRAVGCCLVSEDPALLAEIAAARGLAGLRLVRLAPTVLASGKPPAETLVALRLMGYAPAQVRDDGGMTVARQHRVAVESEPAFDEPRLADPAVLAGRLSAP